jgi:hypothetical protein
MPTNLAQARRNYYGVSENALPRIDGRVKRKTMMGDRSQGPISTRLNRSEMMEKEAEAEMMRAEERGRARAQAGQGQGQGQGMRPGFQAGYDVPVGGASKPGGMLIPGTSAGSSIWVTNDDPRVKKPEKKELSAEDLAKMEARRRKGQQGMEFSRRRAALERSVAQSTGGGQMNWRMPSQQNKVGEMAELRDSGRDIWFGDEKF